MSSPRKALPKGGQRMMSSQGMDSLKNVMQGGVPKEGTL
jgi:hypothetical protein